MKYHQYNGSINTFYHKRKIDDSKGYFAQVKDHINHKNMAAITV